MVPATQSGPPRQTGRSTAPTPSQQPPVLEVRGIRKRFRNTQALDGIDITVHPGEVFGFLGPNGAGKTTFTKCITGFIHRDEGTVRLCGVDPAVDPAGAARQVGLVPDQYDFYSSMTGREHLDFYGSLHDIPKLARQRRIKEVLALVRMTDRADEKVKNYSHGMKQRICIAQAILHRPKLVILDEPTNGLDPKGAYELRIIIKRIAQAGAAVFLNSHILAEVEDTCKRVAIVNRGKLVAMDDVAGLRSSFGSGVQFNVRLQSPSLRALQAARTLVPATSTGPGNILNIPITEDRIPRVLHAIMAAGGRIVEVHKDEDSLEELFLRLTEDDA